MPNRPEYQITYDARENRISNKGVSRAVKFAKRSEAEQRNAATPESKTRAYWRAYGFSRKSAASRLVRETVRDTNTMMEEIRAKSGLSDWAPVPDLG